MRNPGAGNHDSFVLTSLDSAVDSARAQCAFACRSTLLRPEPARIRDGGPSGFGESSALERSRRRKLVGTILIRHDAPVHASSVAQIVAMPTFFRTSGAS